MQHIDTSNLLEKKIGKKQEAEAYDIKIEEIKCMRIGFVSSKELLLSNVTKHFIRKDVLYVYYADDSYFRSNIDRLEFFNVFKMEIEKGIQK